MTNVLWTNHTFRGNYEMLFQSGPHRLTFFDHSMSCDIPEPDWKVFRELHKLALGRLCDKILMETQALLDHSSTSSHEKYLSLYKLIRDRDHDIARGFNDFRRSTALTQIGIIHSMGLFTDEELRRFSPETVKIIELFGPVPPPRD